MFGKRNFTDHGRRKPFGRSTRVKRSLVASLMLTSLVDAFSILVLFLIINHSSSQYFVDADKVTLPKVELSQIIAEGIAVHVQAGQFFMNDKLIHPDRLVAELIEKKKGQDDSQMSLIIVADRDSSYQHINPLLIAGSEAGLSRIKFAVTQQP